MCRAIIERDSLHQISQTRTRLQDTAESHPRWPFAVLGVRQRTIVSKQVGTVVGNVLRADRSCCKRLGQLIHERCQSRRRISDGLADAAVLCERRVLEGLRRDPQLGGDVLLHPGQPLQLLRR